MNSFWWGRNKKERKGICWKSLQELCVHKIEEGMGFRDLYNFNLAMVAKQVWQILMNLSALVTRIYKAQYFQNSIILEASPGRNPSLVWRSLSTTTLRVKEGLRIKVGSSDQVLVVWKDPWLLDEHNPYVLSPPLESLEDPKVNILKSENGRSGTKGC